MTLLWLAVVALIALALGLVLPPLFRSTAPTGASEGRATLARRVYADQLAQLERDLDAQALSPSDRAQAVEELQRQLLEEAAPPEAGTKPPRPWMAWGVALGLSLAVPAAALLLYLQVGDPRAAATLAAGASDMHERAGSGQDMEQAVARLAARLQAQPADAEGWVMLARSYDVMQRYDDAVKAYRTAIAQMPGQPGLLADYADALGSARNGDLSGPAQAAIDAALAIDPALPKALALAGMAAYQRGDVAAARGHWERVRGLLPPDSETARGIEANLAQLDAPPASPVAATTAAVATIATTPSGAKRIAGTVSIAPALRARVPAQATVFVVARAPSEGRMPVAVLRLQAKDLPTRFVLDDSLAMTPDRPLSRFSPLTVEVRVSASGQAMAQSGDLYGAAQQVTLGKDDVVLVVDKTVP